MATARTKKSAAKTETTDAAPEVEKALVLRTVSKDLKSHGGFQWPASGRCEAPDWKPTEECGNGLHGLLDGLGDYGLLHIGQDQGAVVQVVEIERHRSVDLQAKIKFPFCEVKVSGSWADAAKLIVPAMIAGVHRQIAEVTKNAKGAPAATTGYRAPAATTGEGAPAATTGEGAPAATTGYRAPAATTGYRAPAATTGEGAPAATTGRDSVAAALGHVSKAKAGEGGAIMLACYSGPDWAKGKLVGVFAGMIGQTYGDVTLEAGKYYQLVADENVAGGVRVQEAV
jgi:hypothetical protein